MLFRSKCLAGKQAKVCDDGTPCTSDACDPKTGQCVASSGPAGTTCDDGNACTGDGSCQAGVCQSPAAGCDDDNPCTTDTCDPEQGCNYTAVWGCNPCVGKGSCTGADLPGFALKDQNPKSVTYNQVVSPLNDKGKPILIFSISGS
mgnify:FL=1